MCLFSSYLLEILILQRLGRALSPTADYPVRILEEESCLSSILMLGDCVDEKLTLEVAFRSKT